MSKHGNISRLIEEARAGRREAQQAIYELFAPRIFNFLVRLSGSRQEAEDATQQTFLAVLQQLRRLRDPAQLESWIYRIARNEIYQKFRRKRPESLDDRGLDSEVGKIEEERSHANPEKLLLNLELRGRLESALDKLPIKFREVFILAVIQGMNYQDISEIVGRSLLSVKTDIYRARLQLRAELGRYLGGYKMKAESKG
ncbi:MAG TPA: RNA polymerase sigma factor [Acidobacteriota bacterium]|nr:RNA polymerase sigma factor [Acidobacteriota bacterium]